MMYEDRYGNIWQPEYMEELSPWEIEERGFMWQKTGIMPVFNTL